MGSSSSDLAILRFIIFYEGTLSDVSSRSPTLVASLWLSVGCSLFELRLLASFLKFSSGGLAVGLRLRKIPKSPSAFCSVFGSGVLGFGVWLRTPTVRLRLLAGVFAPVSRVRFLEGRSATSVTVVPSVPVSASVISAVAFILESVFSSLGGCEFCGDISGDIILVLKNQSEWQLV